MQGADHKTCVFLFFFFNDPAPTEIYTLSLHDALPIWTWTWTWTWTKPLEPSNNQGVESLKEWSRHWFNSNRSRLWSQSSNN